MAKRRQKLFRSIVYVNIIFFLLSVDPILVVSTLATLLFPSSMTENYSSKFKPISFRARRKLFAVHFSGLGTSKRTPFLLFISKATPVQYGIKNAALQTDEELIKLLYCRSEEPYFRASCM